METLAVNCSSKSVSLSEPTQYFLDSIRQIEYETRKTILNDSEIIRIAMDFLVTKKYPHLFADVKDFIKE